MPLVVPTAPRLRLVEAVIDPGLAGNRLTEYNFELLDRDENFLGYLSTVKGGNLAWSASASIKGGGQIEVQDLDILPGYPTVVTEDGTVIPGKPDRYEGSNAPVKPHEVDIDWLNVRVRPVTVVTDLDTGLSQAYPQGVYLPSTPVEEWADQGRAWRVELLDKASILDGDIYTSGGRPATYTLAAGANVVAAIVALIHSTGEDTPAIPADPDSVLAAAQTWDMGTTLLKIINDLLDTANYFSIWTDEWGQFQITPYIVPMDRPPIYELESPLSYGELSRMDPNWTFDNDIYATPNRVVLIGQGSDTAPAWVATAINNNPTSEFSFISRGRWITYVETEVEAVSQASLQLSAQRRLGQRMADTGTLSVKHVYLPGLRINGLIRFVNSYAEMDTWCVISRTEVAFDPVALCATTLSEVVS